MTDFMNSDFYRSNLHKEVSGEKINKETGNATFYKFICANKKHYGFTYSIGLNEDTIPFNPSEECKPGGLYVTDYVNLPDFVIFGFYVGEIVIPDDARCYLEERKFKCNKLILKSITCASDHPFFENPEFYRRAIKHSIMILQFVKNPIPEICIEVVKQDGYALEFIKKQTPDICMEAVKQNGNVLELVKEQTPEICLEAVKQYGLALVFVKEQTP